MIRFQNRMLDRLRAKVSNATHAFRRAKVQAAGPKRAPIPAPSPRKKVAPMNAVERPSAITDRMLKRDFFAGLLFAPSDLGADHPVDAERVARHMVASEDAAFNTAHRRCQRALHELVELSAPAALASVAVEYAYAEGVDPVEVLDRLTALIEERVKAKTAERQVLAARRQAYRARVMPLRLEVSRRLTGAQAELRVLNERRLLVRDVPQENQYQKLRDAGLTAEDLAKLGRLDPVDQTARKREEMQARVLILRQEIAACQAFTDDPLHSVEHLAGLDGFGELIAQVQATSKLPV